MVRIPLQRAAVHDIVIPPLELAGQVLDAANQQPLFPAVIGLHDLQRNQRRITTTDARGQFRFEGLIASNYVLLATASARYDVSLQRLSLATSTNDLTIALPPAEGVPLRLRAASPELEFVEINLLSGGAKIATLAPRISTQGIVELPPGITDQTLEITTKEHQPIIVRNWDGRPLERDLQRLQGR